MTRYTSAITEHMQYGIDFIAADGSEVKEMAFDNEADREVLYNALRDDENHPEWPDNAVRIQAWSRWVRTTKWVAQPNRILRNPATGRFMRSAYRENLGY